MSALTLALAVWGWASPSSAQPSPAAQERPSEPTRPARSGRGDPCCLLSVRGDLGVGVLLGNPSGFAVTVGAAAGARVFVSRDPTLFSLIPEVGVRATTGYPGQDSTVLTAGLGLSLLRGAVGVSWRPQFVAGWRQGEGVLGLRNGVSLDLFLGIVYAEVAHQYLTGDQGESHEMQLSVGLDPGELVHLIVMLVGSMPRSTPPPPPVTVAR